MKMMKKLGALVLALCMCMALCVTAFATDVTTGNGGSGSITIQNAQENETYSVYKMLNLTYSEDNKSYSYTVVSEWQGFFAGTGYGATYFDVDANGSVTLKDAYADNDSWMADLAKAALRYATTNGIKAVVSGTADQSGITFTGLEMGWYLVDTSLGSLCSIDTVTTSATIKEKNPTPDIDKKVRDATTNETWTKEDTASVGDELEFEIFITDAAHSSSLCLHDEMTDGLTFTDGSVTVEYAVVEGGDYESSEISWTTAPENSWSESDAPNCNDEKCTFELSFTDEWLDTLSSNTVIKVTYKAIVNDEAIDTDALWDAENNTAHLTFGTNSYSENKVTETDTVGFELIKVDNNYTTLTGAEFTLYSDAEHTHAVQLVYNETAGVYEVATDGQVQVSNGIATTTITAGDIKVEGLAEGTYYLVETKAPEGYNMLTSDIVITITITRDTTGAATGETVTMDNVTAEKGVVYVINNAGSELPSTGGIGTTIFYIAGAVLICGAAVVLVTRRRMNRA